MAALRRLFSAELLSSWSCNYKLCPLSVSKRNFSTCDWSSFRSRRALLYVPLSDIKKLEKITSLSVDSVVLDLEDGVAFNRKDTARANISAGLSYASQTNNERVVRVNDITSGFISSDLQAALSNDDDSCNRVEGIMLPKCESVEHLKQLDFLVGFYRRTSRPYSLIIIIESVAGLRLLSKICEYGVNGLKNVRLETVTFGSDDYTASLGVHRTDSSQELLYARHILVATVKSYGLQAIDLVNTDFKNLDNLRITSEEGARMGFTGKQIIHPSQIDIVQSAFSPSQDLLAWAEGLISSYNKHQKSGKGAFVYNGKMIDRPLVLQAQNIINQANVKKQ